MFSAYCRILVAVVALSIGTVCEAAWQRASSAHFVIYADENPADLGAFAQKLEKFDKAVRIVRKMDDPAVGDGNRLTVFVVRSDGDVQRLIHDKTGFIRGFYIPRASGSVAFVPRRTGNGSEWDLDADTVFFHEYSHHLMMQDLSTPAPPWFVEGFAEFMSTARFEKDGSVGLGIVPKHRAYSLFIGQRMPIESILAGSKPRQGTEENESLYARGWLLSHYLTFEPSRQGQLQQYLAGIAKGVDPLQSARTAFGDLKQLDRELDKYVERPKLKYVKVAATVLNIGRIDVQPLSPGAAAALPLRIQSKRGVNRQTAEPLAAQVRAVEARYPGDELVELTLAEAEIDAGHVDASEAAADRALKANPRDTKALIFKGRAMARRAQSLTGDARRIGFGQAREELIAANKLETEDPEPLMYFYRSYLMEGIRPTPNAIAALHYASDLAPQDKGLRMNSAARYLADGKLAEAKRALTPVAYDPHGDELAQVARAMIDKIDAGNGTAALKASVAAPAAAANQN